MIEDLFNNMTERIKKEWYQYFKMALIYAMIFQVSFVFDFLWFDRTFTMLAYVFIFSFIVQFLTAPLHKYLKLVIDICVTIVIGMKFSNMWSTFDGSSFLDQAILTFLGSWQFSLIGISLLILAKFVLQVTQTRLHVSIFFTLGLFILLIVDSFSPIVLWKHVVACIILFLFWHMIWHYERIRQANESEFEVIFENPLSIFTPFSIVISFAIVVALILPYGPPWLEDPYALWKKSRGEEVPAFLGEKGFKTTTVVNPNRLSGYSRSSEVLGGGFDFNYETVMQIDTNKKSYWRGETINFYDGIGWKNTNPDYTAVELVPSNQIAITERPLATTQIIQARVKVLRERGYPVLFHANELIGIDQVDYKIHDYVDFDKSDESNFYMQGDDGEQFVIFNEQYPLPGVFRSLRDNTVFYQNIEYPDGYPVSYRFTSEVLQLDVEKLQQASATIPDPILHELYTALPDTLPQEVKDLALLITEPANSDYEKARLLEEYLKLNYAYDNRPNEDKLSGEQDDFVYKFLFELYEGYCDYFSTSMAVMAKSLGMPARWVKGFAPGVNTSEQYLQQLPMFAEEAESMRNELSGGLYQVRNADAHSWLEIYFDGFGWISFEPTPGFTYPYEYVSEESAALEIKQQAPVTDEAEPLEVEKKNSYNYVGLTLIVLSLLLVAAVIFVWNKVGIGELKQKIIRWRYKHYTNNERVVAQFNQFMNYSSRKGLKRHQGQTAYEAISSWTHGSKHWKNQLAQLYQLFEKAKYSAVQLDNEQVEQVSEIIKGLKKQWKL